ncbi:asparaginase-domain-containing protein [Dichomitus squalens]|uniref:asparaginase-domain-containing protein n=1 Tax=Dichomitus squalens (strain LYAD-421) TaxID=732165 RepID=UPI0004412690|nr:asparaginase-domain-containing protein [Dichomitus squalens LYAD-421 SS1]EJF66300.1 asparaginase-domain-containing protein [Dichomitus squalens LYAD-421 SS1]TBU46431.1 asparaginase-domain-containing protein [Dichomitus squalens]
MNISRSSEESKVLILNTGGTINMIFSQKGYVPEPYFLTETLHSEHRFHDPLEESLFSHSGSIEGYRRWTSSGKNTPVGATSRSREPSPSCEGSRPEAHQLLTLPVRSSRPIGALQNLAASPEQIVPLRQPVCVQISEDVYEAQLPTLVTPRSSGPGGSRKRIRYAVLEWSPLLDSSNIEIQDWIRIASDIELNYSNFDGFVILHGTDTMSYTSSALSFMLEDLGKTVVVTGAQIPISQLRNDAVDNLLGALVIAGHYIIPECCLYFNHTLFRGNRVSKMSSYDLNAFNSPNFPPLVNVGIDIMVNWQDVLRQTSLRRFRSHKLMSPHVATLRLFPGITGATIRAFVMHPTQGVVLETFGAGNAPQRADLVAALKEACDNGVVIVAISQCSKGSVSDAYETGRSLLEAGVVPGGDMTPECALTKLSYLLSKPELSVAQVRSLIGTPLRGELTLPESKIPAVLSKPSAVGPSLDNLQGLLSQVVRLSTISSSGARSPRILVDGADARDEEADEATAPWSWTAAEASSIESSLFPFLVHLAVARDDPEAVSFALSVESNPEASSLAVSGGLANCADPASGRSPLHVAALNGSICAANMLLEAGALVHVRDALGHTPLYYAARQGHEELVELLVKAGANLGGTDVDGGYVSLAVAKAGGYANSLAVWKKAGATTPCL